MKTLDRYILFQLITVTALGVLSLTLLMLLGQLFKELHSLLVESGAPPSIVVDFILQVIPFSLTFTVPWGFLTAVLLVYGRLAADNELTSMRMAGLSLWRLSAPAIGLAIVLSGLCYYINIEIAPKGKQAMSELVMRAATDNPRNLLNASQDATRIDKTQLYIEKRSGDDILGLHVYPVDDSGTPSPTMGNFDAMHAEKARIGAFDEKQRILSLELSHCTIEAHEKGATHLVMVESMPLRIHIPLRTHRKLKPNRFTNSEIAGVLSHTEQVAPIDLVAMKGYSTAASRQEAFPCASFLWATALSDAEYYQRGMNQKNISAFKTEGVQRASFACACLVFALIGVPLAITARRRDTSTGFFLGIMVAAVYFMALVLCELSRKSSGITPYIVLWLPNVIGIAFAIWQHRRAKYRG